jgi:hypothetical protein
MSICIFFIVTFFWWKLIDRIFFNQIFNTRVVFRGIYARYFIIIQQ